MGMVGPRFPGVFKGFGGVLGGREWKFAKVPFWGPTRFPRESGEFFKTPPFGGREEFKGG